MFVHRPCPSSLAFQGVCIPAVWSTSVVCPTPTLPGNHTHTHLWLLCLTVCLLCYFSVMPRAVPPTGIFEGGCGPLIHASLGFPVHFLQLHKGKTTDLCSPLSVSHRPFLSDSDRFVLHPTGKDCTTRLKYTIIATGSPSTCRTECTTGVTSPCTSTSASGTATAWTRWCATTARGAAGDRKSAACPTSPSCPAPTSTSSSCAKPRLSRWVQVPHLSFIYLTFSLLVDIVILCEVQAFMVGAGVVPLLTFLYLTFS